MLPLRYLSGVGQLIRDLISLDPHAKLIGRWTATDHLFLAALMSDRIPKLRRFSETLANGIDAWLESKPIREKSLLFTEWVLGTDQRTKADELLGSLDLGAMSRSILWRLDQ
jgi:hypothetical protein